VGVIVRRSSFSVLSLRGSLAEFPATLWRVPPRHCTLSACALRLLAVGILSVLLSCGRGAWAGDSLSFVGRGSARPRAVRVDRAPGTRSRAEPSSGRRFGDGRLVTRLWRCTYFEISGTGVTVCESSKVPSEYEHPRPSAARGRNTCHFRVQPSRAWSRALNPQ
jgi:hypothetical protein